MKNIITGDRVYVNSKAVSFFSGEFGTVKNYSRSDKVYDVQLDCGRRLRFFEDEIEKFDESDLERTEIIEQPPALDAVSTGGTKHDDGKPDFSLLSSVWLVGVVRVLTKGKAKYAAHNWRLGIQIARLLAGVMRHIALFLAGIDYDVNPKCEGCIAGNCKKHTGEHHLSCASCGLMFATELALTRPDLDDRYKLTPEVQQHLLESMESK